MFDEDFSSICGEFANLNGDGKVDMEEYLNKEDDYNRIMRTDGEDEDEDYSLDDEDEDDEEEEEEEIIDSDENEEDFEWTKYKFTERGNVYEKTVKNPVRQVKRQIYLLAKYLDYHGVKVWVKGYALFIHGNSPIKSESILYSAHEIDKAIHTKDREFLSYQTIEKIKKLLD